MLKAKSRDDEKKRGIPNKKNGEPLMAKDDTSVSMASRSVRHPMRINSRLVSMSFHLRRMKTVAGYSTLMLFVWMWRAMSRSASEMCCAIQRITTRFNWIMNVVEEPFSR